MKIAILAILVTGSLATVATSSIIPAPGIGSTKSSRVVGGNEAKPHSAPFIVSFREIGDHICGGSIINKFWILSAAHCFLDVVKAVAVAGIHSITDEGQRRDVERYVTHENYSGRVGPFDISVVKVAFPFEFNEFVQPVTLPTPNRIPFGNVTVFGWGSTSDSLELEMPDVLHTVTKPVVAYSECLETLPEIDKWKLRESNVCTGPLTGGISACVRDSGGPLVKRTSRGSYELVGIVSWGYFPCGMDSRPSVYTRVSAFIEWMYENIYT